jgi:hypothetical protein
MAINSFCLAAGYQVVTLSALPPGGGRIILVKLLLQVLE